MNQTKSTHVWIKKEAPTLCYWSAGQDQPTAAE